MAKYANEQILALGLRPDHLPRHVAIIMDGNGRWANAHNMARPFGHRAGTDRLRGIIRLSSDIGVEALTLYAFSTENWKRPDDEIGMLMSLLIEYFNKEIHELNANGVRIRALGDIGFFPAKVRQAIENAQQRTRDNAGLKLNIALNYGSHAEILRAANLAAQQMVRSGGTEITRQMLESHLYTADCPEVDLLIRTGGEQRMSNFLLYQASYAELYFANDFWPDFSDEKYVDALKIFVSRSRRFGGLEKKT